MFLGSRDGWAPKHFKSSRENRIKESNDRGQKPEDFMDDEDMGDFGIAPQKIQNAAKFRKEKDDLGKVIYHKYILKTLTTIFPHIVSALELLPQKKISLLHRHLSKKLKFCGNYLN